MDELSSSEDDAADRDGLDVVESERRATPPGAVDDVDATIEEDELDDERSAEDDASSLNAATEAALLALPRSAFMVFRVREEDVER